MPAGEIPNTDGTTVGDIRSGVYASDFDPFIMGAQRYGVVSGCAPTAHGGTLGVDVVAGVIENDGTQITVVGGSPAVTLSTADATNPRIDLIEVSSSGTVGKVTGTPAAVPVAPAGTAGSVRLGRWVVPAGLTALVTATHLVDQRVTVATGPESQQAVVAAEVFA